MSDKVLHIIPGWKDSCNHEQYQRLGQLAEQKRYKVVFHDVNWKQSLSRQVFGVSKNDVVFGFSLGAILAWLVAQENSCKHIILASMTPHYSFTKPNIKETLIELTGQVFVDDIISHLETINKAKKQTVMYGNLEEESGDIIVQNTEHELTKTYISEIVKIL